MRNPQYGDRVVPCLEKVWLVGVFIASIMLLASCIVYAVWFDFWRRPDPAGKIAWFLVMGLSLALLFKTMGWLL